jgi:hypothetical protein
LVDASSKSVKTTDTHVGKRKSMKRVILESPYAGDVDSNIEYARKAMRDSLLRGEAPMASHLLYTQPFVLDDNDANERQLGIDAGLMWGPVAEATVVYADRGVSRGMKFGMDRAVSEGRPVEMRYIELMSSSDGKSTK